MTARFTFMTGRHATSPVQAPSQPTNELPLLAVAVRVTVTPLVNWAEQPVAAATPLVIVQLIPAGLEVTVPLPVPPPEMVRALTVVAAALLRSLSRAGSSQAWSRTSDAAAAVTSAAETVSERVVGIGGSG